MDSVTSAALIGAGVGAGSSLIAQLLTHRLSLSRDRRNQLRAQRLAAIETAALSLAKSKADRDRPEAPEGSLLGDHPEILPLAEDMSQAIALLQVHFGTDHQVARAYADTWAVCANAKVEMTARNQIIENRLRATYGDDVTLGDVKEVAQEEVEASARAALRALDARDAWVKLARNEAMKT